MIPTDLGSRLSLATESSVQPLTPVKEVSSDIPGLVPGMRISARVESLMSDGNVRASVGGQTITLSVTNSDPEKPVSQLAALRPGQTLDLTVLGRTPRLLITQLTDTATNSAATSLSRPGQLISALLGQGNPAPAALARGEALLATPSAEGFGQLPQKLQQAVSESGLFYESHQMQWVAGQRPTEALLREPQGAHSSLLQSSTASPLDTSPQTNGVAQSTGATARSPDPGDGPHLPQVAAGALPPDRGLPADLTFLLRQQLGAYQSQQSQGQAAPPAGQTAKQDPGANTPPDMQAAARPRDDAKPPVGTSPAMNHAAPAHSPSDMGVGSRSAMAVLTATHAATEAMHSSGLPADLTPLVQQQLDAASSGHLMWTGQIWPGQNMEWHIEEDGHHRDTGAEDQPRQWKTSLRLNLPNLGDIEASMTLTSAGVSIALASGAGSDAALRAAVPQLDNALSAAGVPLTGLQVMRREQP